MKKIIPFGDRLLVKRRIVGDTIGKEGIIVAPDTTKETKTDLADVVYAPEHTLADFQIISEGEEIVKALTAKAKEGDSQALIALLQLNQFLKIKSIQPGDAVMINKYVGTNFHDNKGGGELTLVNGSDIIGLVIDETP